MTVSIPKVQTTDRLINQLQQNIIAGLKPITSNQQNQGTIVAQVTLQPVGSGTPFVNVVKHGLGYPLTGWSIVRKRATADVWDNQDMNSTPSTTLLLFSSALVTVDLYVF
jgi:hypothetical protein